MGWKGIKDYGFGANGRTKEYDDEVRRKGMVVRKGRKRIWTRVKCIEEMEDILKSLKKILRKSEKLEVDNPVKLKRESVRDLITMQNKVMDFMKILYPPTQVNLNLNVEGVADVVLERLRNYKTELVLQKGGIENGGS